jgi:hypothetical protein
MCQYIKIIPPNIICANAVELVKKNIGKKEWDSITRARRRKLVEKQLRQL